LISDRSVKSPSRRVSDEEKDFYGKNYWFGHQEKDLNYPNILERAQDDLAGRCAHWLDILLQYKLPPGKILEVGSAHGGFVALLQWAGFKAAGLELSPWVVINAKENFGVPVFQGPVEDQDIESDSLDVIVMMDVLEHFPNPQGTLRHCLNLLKREGFFFIQTPRYPEGSSFEELVDQKNPFIEQLKGNEHLFLFSENSIREFFSRLGCEYVRFVPAVFPHYDMSLIASRKRLIKRSYKNIQKTLIKSPSGRLIQAFLRVKSNYQELRNELDLSNSDRKERLIQIEKLTKLLNESEKDRKSRMVQIEKLTRLLEKSEQDRKERMTQIHELTGLLKDSEKDRKSRMVQIETLTRLLEKSEQDREARMDRIDRWEARYKKTEADREARMVQIRKLTRMLKESERDREARMTQINKLSGLLKDSEKDRKSRMVQIETLTRLLEKNEQDREARMAQINELTGLLKKSEQDREARMDQIDELTRLLRACETNRAESAGIIEVLDTKISNLKEKMVTEENKALELEKDLNALERTRIVRAARGMGLIKVRRMNSQDDSEKEG
jgi:2-polyprenyl-3-methyl-5-hydroxy-6-metoxy-1,4-benzoquinol methylase